MKIKLRITYTDKVNAYNEFQATGSMPQIFTRTKFMEIEIPDGEGIFNFEELSVEK